MERKLGLWVEGEIGDILKEALTLQKSMKVKKVVRNLDTLRRTFSQYMSPGNINASLRVLDQTESNGILPINADTLKLYKRKHPKGQTMSEHMIQNGLLSSWDEIIFCKYKC